MRNIHNHAKVEKTSATCNNKRWFVGNLHVLRGLKHGMGGWWLVKRTIFLSYKINWYFMVIYILRLNCFFFLIFSHIFPTQQNNFCSYWRIFQIIPYPTSHPKDRVVNVCKHKFACTNVTPKRRNGAHFITHAPYCAWVTSQMTSAVTVGHLLCNCVTFPWFHITSVTPYWRWFKKQKH